MHVFYYISKIFLFMLKDFQAFRVRNSLVLYFWKKIWAIYRNFWKDLGEKICGWSEWTTESLTIDKAEIEKFPSFYGAIRWIWPKKGLKPKLHDAIGWKLNFEFRRHNSLKHLQDITLLISIASFVYILRKHNIIIYKTTKYYEKMIVCHNNKYFGNMHCTKMTILCLH
jgi:hypothetical protein